MARLLKVLVGGAALACAGWWLAWNTSIASPVSAGQDAQIKQGGEAALSDDVARLDRLLEDQRGGATVTGADLLGRGMLPVSGGTRVRVLALGWDGLNRTARVQVTGDDALVNVAKVLALRPGPVEGWTLAEWLVP